MYDLSIAMYDFEEELQPKNTKINYRNFPFFSFVLLS